MRYKELSDGTHALSIVREYVDVMIRNGFLYFHDPKTRTPYLDFTPEAKNWFTEMEIPFSVRAHTGCIHLYFTRKEWAMTTKLRWG